MVHEIKETITTTVDVKLDISSNTAAQCAAVINLWLNGHENRGVFISKVFPEDRAPYYKITLKENGVNVVGE